MHVYDGCKRKVLGLTLLCCAQGGKRGYYSLVGYHKLFFRIGHRNFTGRGSSVLR